MSYRIILAKYGQKTFGHYLALDVHDDHRIGPVTDHKVLRVPGHKNDIVDRDVCPLRDIWSFDSVCAVCRLRVPDLRKGQ